MLRNIHQDSLLNAFFLSILATAGLFYVNLGGSFLSAFVDGLSIERDAAGFIVSANKYGAAFGGLLAAIFLLGEKPTAELFIGGAIIIFGVIMIIFTKPKNEEVKK